MAMTAERFAGTTIDPDLLTLEAVRAGALRGRPVTVLGLARSGAALARFLVDAGADVTIYDGRPTSELGEAIAGLAGRAVRLQLGPEVEPAAAWAGAALVTTSPSITPDYPTTEPRLRAALQALVAARAAGGAGAPALVSEADLFLRLCPAPTIGVTGTKGKTTTASLTAAILACDPDHPAVLGGNIGRPLIDELAALTPENRVVVELSELQLPTLSRGTTVGVYTNVTSDHLDRHGSLVAYRTVKRRLAELVAADGAVVLNADDPVVAAFEAASAAPAVSYTTGHARAGGLGVEAGWIVANAVPRLSLAGGGLATTLEGGRVVALDDLAIPGRHNISNALAAIAVGLLFGIQPVAIRVAVRAFRGVEHRLETVAVIDGVRFVNDSQGTQPDAVIAALEAFEPPIVLIAGGRDKGVDLSALAREVGSRAVAAVVIGESGPDLARQFGAAGLVRIERADDLDAAVRRAADIAREAMTEGSTAGATVLLSPAAASFDMFTDYAERGRAFKASVARIAASRSAGS
jgi:UDP-N-acetylmuramoylalanine--D-glutamate ligase